MGDSFTSGKVLASHDGKATLVQSGNILAATFHPELSDESNIPAKTAKFLNEGMHAI